MQLHIANIEMTRHLKFQHLSAAALRFGAPSFIQSHLDSSSSLTRTNICDIENADMLYVSSGRSGAERPPSRSGHGMAWHGNAALIPRRLLSHGFVSLAFLSPTKQYCMSSV